ncbi:MAG: efflux RND transporter periplasmic adaptor subunit [Steroidobacteraceae bacterium]
MNDENRYPAPSTPGLADTDDRPEWQKKLRSRRVLVILAVLAAIALLAWLLTPKATRPPPGRFAGGGAMPVVAARVQSGDMPITLIGLGAVTPLATVTVQSQISGQIMKILFKEGQTVKAGAPLLQIDPRPYQVALEQAQGALVRDQALLANARIDLTRYQTLWKQDSIAEQQVATQQSLVVQDEGNVKTDQAQIDAQKLNLVYCHITSPIPGRVGLQQVNVGNYVTPAEPNGLVVITQMKPITVVFTLAEDDLPELMKQVHAGQTLSVTAWDRSNTHQLATGTLQSVDSQIDPTTGTVKLKAIFPNGDESLFPQQFVNVVLLLNTLHGATLIPQAGVQRGAPGTYVYVVGPGNQAVSVRNVSLGPGDANNVSIRQGLTPGELVVVDGADKLKDGAKILLRQPSGAPAANTQGQPSGQAQPGQPGQTGQPAQGSHHRRSKPQSSQSSG